MDVLLLYVSVGFASLGVVCDELNDGTWNGFLYKGSNYCMYVYCVESLAHIECYSDCTRRGAIWLRCYLRCVEPSLYSVVLCTHVAWVCLMFLLLCRIFSNVFAIIERRNMGLYEVSHFVYLLGFRTATI